MQREDADHMPCVLRWTAVAPSMGLLTPDFEPLVWTHANTHFMSPNLTWERAQRLLLLWWVMIWFLIYDSPTESQTYPLHTMYLIFVDKQPAYHKDNMKLISAP